MIYANTRLGSVDTTYAHKHSSGWSGRVTTRDQKWQQ